MGIGKLKGHNTGTLERFSCINIPCCYKPLVNLQASSEMVDSGFLPRFLLAFMEQRIFRRSHFDHTFSLSISLSFFSSSPTPPFYSSVLLFHPKIMFHHSARLYPIILIYISLFIYIFCLPIPDHCYGKPLKPKFYCHHIDIIIDFNESSGEQENLFTSALFLLPHRFVLDFPQLPLFSICSTTYTSSMLLQANCKLIFLLIPFRVL